MAPYVQHYYCHGCHEYIEAIADDNDGYDSDSDEEWEEVMEECPSCGSPFFELLNSEENEANAPTMNTTSSQTYNNNNNTTTNTTGGNSNNHARNRTNNINTTSNTNNNNGYNIPFPPNMPEEVRNMIRNAIGQSGTVPHQVSINIGVLEGEFPSNRDNGLPASCKDFTVDDVVNILNSYPEGVPRVESATQEKNGEEEEEQQQQTASPTNPGPIPNDGTCTVCLESVYAPCSSEVVQMHCSHCYHKACIKSWFEKGVFTCPTCRQPAIKDDASS